MVKQIKTDVGRLNQRYKYGSNKHFIFQMRQTVSNN